MKFTKTTLIVCFCILPILLTRKSDWFEFGTDVEAFIKVIPIWFLSAFVLLFALQPYLKKKFPEDIRLAYWSLICIFSLFNWFAVKADTNSYEPRDNSFDMKPRFERESSDSVELAKEKIHSTIGYVHSIEKTEKVYLLGLTQKEFFFEN